ncbi:vanadium-dependent haloperoxidase [Aegicerativicinus sediminis]|uniref:vanadium-dependent haloperoxidase n=1 Tax=Aegicerativicinus sediminis TaxID=2893202 RepID=UPI001E5FB83D|nr:vanadium-dependent haloperoxidase [Aegicerativicinus sediminis]
MKTNLKLLATVILFTIIASCEKEELELDSELLSSSQSQDLGKYNNGMIKSYNPGTVLKWNELLSANIDEKVSLPVEVKIYAMVTLAMHDALNNVVPKFETYALDNTMVDASDISKKNIQAIGDAAVSQAARDVMVSVFPSSLASADALLDNILSSIEDESTKAQGVEIGKAAAQALFQKRQNDIALVFQKYNAPNNDPGTYQANFPPFSFPTPNWPAGAVFAPDLGELEPFGIASNDQFLNEGPHAINSDAYTKDYNEIKSLGCLNCPERTTEQTLIGTFWTENPASSMNRLARTLIEEHDLNGWEAARLIAMVEMALIDSFIASFEEKNHFNFWAPITAIKAGDNDGNPDTVGDITWTAVRTTPPILEFPASTPYGVAAASEIFRLYFGSDEISLMATSFYTPGLERQLYSFTQITKENGESRLYNGHHFRRSIEIGEHHGIMLGKYIFENNLEDYR